jgi:hypothetical protein
MDIETTAIPIMRIEWTVTDGAWTYQDVMEMTEEEYAAETPETIRAKQDKKYKAWKEYVTKPIKKGK